jgi:hypothetical protein
MKRILFLIAFAFTSQCLIAQDVSMRVTQVNYTSADPDGGGPATGQVTFQFELIASSAILADGFGFSMAYQTSQLMATPTNTTVPVGPLATAVAWTQQVDNRVGNPILPAGATYGGQTFNQRMIITFNQNAGIPNCPVPTTWTPFAQITYWTLGNSYPQGGYIVAEPGTIVAQNEVSSDGGLSTYPTLSPNLNTPAPLGLNVTPVTFSKYDVRCSDRGTTLTWSTSAEYNTSYFEVEKSANGSGNDWRTIGKTSAAGNSSVNRNYQYLDLEAGTAAYRIKQVDINGRITYTDIKRSSCEAKSLDVVLYPVPAKDRLTVAIRASRAARVNLNVIDATGRIVLRQSNTTINAGNNNILLDVHNLPAGDYILVSSDPSVYINQKFVIAR